MFRKPWKKRNLVGVCAVPTVVISLTACSSLGGLSGGLVGNDDDELPEGLRTVDAAWIEGLSTEEYTVSADGRQITSRYPVVPGAAAFTVDIRTTMAERETEFLTEDTAATLEQEAEFLVASGGVLGARITARTDDAVEATTRWYDVRSGESLPWTALLNGEDAIEELGARVALALNEEHGLDADAMPAGLPALGDDMETSPSPSAEPELVDPETAWQSAADHAGSPLADLGFDAAGELVVSINPTAIGQDEETQLTVDGSESLLSRFGRSARAAVVADDRSLQLASTELPDYTLDCGRVPCVALTFDDGPGPDTDLLLDHLDAYSAKATFYVLGQLAAEHPATVRRAAEEGHEVANHSWKHDNLATLGGAAVSDDMERTWSAIEEAVDGGERSTMRPPYGSFNDTTQANIDYPMILWDVDTLDWEHRDTAKTVNAAVSGTRPGSIVLFHDIHRPTVDAIPEVLRQLHAKGYHFVTVTDLFGDLPLEPGVAYSRRGE